MSFELNWFLAAIYKRAKVLSLDNESVDDGAWEEVPLVLDVAKPKGGSLGMKVQLDKVVGIVEVFAILLKRR